MIWKMYLLMSDTEGRKVIAIKCFLGEPAQSEDCALGFVSGIGCLTYRIGWDLLCARGLKRSVEASAAVQQFIRQKTTEVRQAGSSRDTPLQNRCIDFGVAL